MNIVHGGKLHPNIFWRIRQYEIENRYEHFPGYGTETLERYLRVLEESGQFATIYDSIFNEPIAFMLWWFLPTLEMCKNKSWEEPFPENLNDGDYCYVDWNFVHPNYRHLNLIQKMFTEIRERHPRKHEIHICWHWFRPEGQRFYHKRPLQCEDALSVVA